MKAGGSLTLIFPSEPSRGFDPVGINGSGAADGTQAALVFDVLVYADPASGSTLPGVASSLTSSDAVVWTLKLRPNVKFSDGTPYDAAAVKFNWERMQDPANTAVKAAQANLIQSMDVVDAQTLNITLKTKNAVFPAAVTFIPFIGSPTAIKKDATAFNSAPVGAGPFVLKSWTRQAQAVFERNPGYWNAPQPYLDRVTINVATDESQRINTYTAGGADMVQVGAASAVAQMRAAGNAGVEVMNIQNGGSLLFLNTKKLPFSDIRARQALAYGIDRNDYVKAIDSGVLDPIDSLFRHDSPFYDPSLVEPAYDPAKAQQLIDAYVADNGPLNFTLTSFPTEPYPTQAQYIQGVMNKYKNVKVNVVVEGLPAHLANCFSGNFDAACNAAVFWTDPEPAWTSVYTCDAKPNATGWCNPQFDKYVADNRATLNPNQRITDMKEAQRIFYSELPSISFDRRGAWKFYKPYVKNASFVNDNVVLLAGAWLDK